MTAKRKLQKTELFDFFCGSLLRFLLVIPREPLVICSLTISFVSRLFAQMLLLDQVLSQALLPECWYFTFLWWFHLWFFTYDSSLSQPAFVPTEFQNFKILKYKKSLTDDCSCRMEHTPAVSRPGHKRLYYRLCMTKPNGDNEDGLVFWMNECHSFVWMDLENERTALGHRWHQQGQITNRRLWQT